MSKSKVTSRTKKPTVQVKTPSTPPAPSKPKITHLQIFGERNSGTKYFERMMEENFGVKCNWSFGFKHWLTPDIEPLPAGFTDTGRSKSILTDKELVDSTLFVVVGREFVEWATSMYARRQHIRYTNPKARMVNNVIRACQSPHESVYEERTVIGNWEQSSAFLKIEEYPSLMALRKAKYDHWMKLRALVKNFEYVQYEEVVAHLKSFRDKYEFPKTPTTIHNLDTGRDPQLGRPVLKLQERVDVFGFADVEWEKKVMKYAYGQGK